MSNNITNGAKAACFCISLSRTSICERFAVVCRSGSYLGVAKLRPTNTVAASASHASPRLYSTTTRCFNVTDVPVQHSVSDKKTTFQSNVDASERTVKKPKLIRKKPRPTTSHTTQKVLHQIACARHGFGPRQG